MGQTEGAGSSREQRRPHRARGRATRSQLDPRSPSQLRRAGGEGTRHAWRAGRREWSGGQVGERAKRRGIRWMRRVFGSPATAARGLSHALASARSGRVRKRGRRRGIEAGRGGAARRSAREHRPKQKSGAAGRGATKRRTRQEGLHSSRRNGQKAKGRAEEVGRPAGFSSDSNLVIRRS